MNDMDEVFQQLKKYNLRLNPAKCTFGVEVGKFLGYMLTNKEIKVNPNKCKVIIEMKSPSSIKEVQQLAGRIAALTRFLPASAKKPLPLFRALKKKNQFE